MEVSIRNKWVSLRGGSTVKDLSENDVLRVQGKFWTFTRKKFVKDLNGNTLYVVRNKFWTLFARKALVYNAEGEVVARIRRKIFSMHDRYFIESALGEMEIKGNILLHDYHITLNGKEIGHIARRISLRDSYVLSLDDDQEIAFFVALCIAIDNITDQMKEDAAAAS